MNKLHPLSLLVLALWFSSAALALNAPLWLLGVWLLSLLAAWLSRSLDLKLWLRQLIRLLPLLAVILMIQALFVKQGRLLGGQGWYAVHAAALSNGIAFCLRLLILLGSARLMLRLEFEDYEAAFAGLRLPEELGFMVFYTVRILPMLNRRLGHNRLLLRLRGLDWRKLPLRARLLVYQRVALALLAEMLTRSGIQAIALELRGFRSPGPRSRLQQRSFGLGDLVFLMSLIALTVSLLILYSR